MIDNKYQKFEAELNKTLPTNRHNLIDTTEFLNKFKSIKDNFLENLDKLEEKQIDVHNDDLIRDELENILKNNMGEPPQDQKEIDNLYADGEKRYKQFIPPGYMDEDKDKEPYPIYTYGGIVYKRKFGDLVVWKQIIEYASKNNIKNIIFIPDDTKEDWFYEIKSQTIGTRPELIDEIQREADVEMFHLYKPDRFLEYAN